MGDENEKPKPNGHANGTPEPRREGKDRNPKSEIRNPKFL